VLKKHVIDVVEKVIMLQNVMLKSMLKVIILKEKHKIKKLIEIHTIYGKYTFHHNYEINLV
jgi:hypothetical protein